MTTALIATIRPRRLPASRRSWALGVLAACALAAPAHESGAPQQPPWQAPTLWPDRIVATLPGDPTTSFAVSWRTSVNVGEAVAQIAPASADTRFDLAARTLPSRGVKVALHGFAGPDGDYTEPRNAGLPAVRYHTVTFNGLEPDRLYAYRVSGEGERFSPWRQLRTAPRNPPFTFLFFGDSQTGIRSHVTRLFDTARRVAPEARFAIHGGDLVNKAFYDREWAEWFVAAGPSHRLIPILPVAGNHDYLNLGAGKLFESTVKTVTPLWRPQFALPVGSSLPPGLHETVYDVRYGGTLHVFVLDSSGVRFDAQLAWLERRLRASDAKWRVLTMHHPLFSFVGGGEGPAARSRRLSLLEVLGRNDVDVVLSGHRHTYHRAEAGEGVARFDIATPHDLETLFIVTASSTKRGATKVDGWRRYSESMRGSMKMTRHADNTPIFAVFDVGDDDLRYRAYDAVGDVYDACSIIKTPDKAGGYRKRIVNGPEAAGPIRDYENTGPYEKIVPTEALP